MSILDKVVAAVTPPESDETRAKAREQARAAAAPGDWLSMILEHHIQIEAAFETVRTALDSDERVRAYRRLATLLTGHSMAEEAVMYPALAAADEKAHATKAYTEQSAAKLQIGLLEDIPPMSQDFLDKLEHVRGAVAHHVYEEEGTWYPDLKRKMSQQLNARLSRRYAEEFDRYMGSDTQRSSASRTEWTQSPVAAEVRGGGDGRSPP